MGLRWQKAVHKSKSRCPDLQTARFNIGRVNPPDSLVSLNIGEIEPTSNTVVARAAGPPVFQFNLGECSYDDAGIDEVLRKMEADYNEEEYDFFFRNCNHFADDLGRRLSGGNEVDRKFMEDFVIFESESLLCNMASFQRSMTMAVTRQIQKIVIVSWRRSWKKALAEEAEASKVTT